MGCHVQCTFVSYFLRMCILLVFVKSTATIKLPYTLECTNIILFCTLYLLVFLNVSDIFDPVNAYNVFFKGSNAVQNFFAVRK